MSGVIVRSGTLAAPDSEISADIVAESATKGYAAVAIDAISCFIELVAEDES